MLVTAFLTLKHGPVRRAYRERNSRQLSSGSSVLSCPFLTTENLLCTCSNWALSAKHLASPENCSIKSQPRTPTERRCFPNSPGKSSFSLGPFSGLNSDLNPLFSFQRALLWVLALTWPCILHSTLGSSAGQPWVALGLPECPVPIMSIFIQGEEMDFLICYSPLLFSPETNAKGTSDILSVIW